MLRSLYIRDYALIQELDVAFTGGLNIITGETGAGKSILIGALKMILGERASVEAIREGARKAVIEGVFDEADTPFLKDLLEQNEIETGPEILVRREISAGNSRAFINDTPATVQLLRDVAAQLIDLHGQHEHQSLLRAETHLGMLDGFSNVGDLRDAYSETYATVMRLVHERRDLRARERDLARQKDLLAFQIEEIDRVSPGSDEEDTLEAEKRVLENAEFLFAATARVYEALYGSDEAATGVLAVARNDLQDLARIDPVFEESVSEIASARIAVDEVAQMLQRYNSRIEFNPERLEEIRERLGAFDQLKRKYGGTIEAVRAFRAEIGASYQVAVDFEGAIARLNTEIEAQQLLLGKRARVLSEKRREGAQRLEQLIVQELAALGIGNAAFDVRFTTVPDADGWIPAVDTDAKRLQAFPTGQDQVEFFISTNLGESPKPLVKTASGGEVSRIMLALKTILARSERLPILVFDEIDVGISGATARKVGEAMHALGRFHQIIAITHHPQIAALGDSHYFVAKAEDGLRTRTSIRRLDDDDRPGHIAALISGDAVSEAALRSARELMRMPGAS